MKLKTLLCLLLAAPAAFAAPVSVSNTQAIITGGQLFNFSFPGLPTVGGGGTFSITLNGDYSGFDVETSTVTLDGLVGSLLLGDHTQANGITSNTIAGLSLNSYTRTSFNFDDEEQTWVFDITNPVLATMLADGILSAVVQNDINVDPFKDVNPDFVRVGFDFESRGGGANDVPEPGTLALMGLGLLGGIAARRRRQ